MNIIVVGCGRVGSQLAALLSGVGHNVTVVDKDPNSFKMLGRDFNGRTVRGLGFDENVLQEAGIQDCDALAAVTDLDTSNLMTAEVARKLYGVPHVVARLYNPQRETAYLQLGLDYVCGTTLVAQDIFTKIQSGRGHRLESFGDYDVLRFSLKLDDDDEFSSIMVSDLERGREVRICCYDHNGESGIPTPDTVLQNGDLVVAVVNAHKMKDFERFIRN